MAGSEAGPPTRPAAGFAFLQRLTAAIAEATDALVARDASAFVHRGANLRGAVERALYLELVDDAQAMAAFGVAPPAPSPIERSSALAADVLRRLSAGREAVAATVRPRPELRRVVGAAAWQLRNPPVRARDGDAGQGSVWFVLEHARMVRFLWPVLTQMPEQTAVVASTFATDAPLELPAGVRHVPLSLFTPAVRPLRRRVASGLRDHLPLVAAQDRLCRVLRTGGASTLVTAEGMSPVSELAAQAAHTIAARSVCVQQGWSPVVHPGFRNLSCDVFATWGEGFVHLLEPHNPVPAFVVCGNIAIGGPPSASRELATLAGDRPVLAVFLQPTSVLNAAADVEALLALVELIAQDAPHALLLVRAHPGYPLSGDELARFGGHPNIVFVPAEVHSLQQVLGVARATLSIYSTSLLEGAALGVPALSFNPTTLPRLSPDLDALGAGVETATLDSARRAARRLLCDDDYIASFAAGTREVRARFFAGVPDDAAGAVARLIAGD